MVKCPDCKKSFPRLNRVVVETKMVDHPVRVYEHRGKEVHDPGGRGTQIVREKVSCGCK